MKKIIKQATYWSYFLCFYLFWIAVGMIVSFSITVMILPFLGLESSLNLTLIIEAVIIILFPILLFKKTNWKHYIENRIEKNTLRYDEFKQFRSEKSFKVLTTYSLNYYLEKGLGTLLKLSLFILFFSYFVTLLYEISQDETFKQVMQPEEFVKITSQLFIIIIFGIAFTSILINVVNNKKNFVLKEIISLVIACLILYFFIGIMNRQGWEKVLDISFPISLVVFPLMMFARMFQKILRKKIIHKSGFCLSSGLGKSENVEHIVYVTIQEFKDVNSFSMSKNIIMNETYRKYLSLEKFDYVIRKSSGKGVRNFGQVDEFGNDLSEEYTPIMYEVTIDFKIKFYRVPLSINSRTNGPFFIFESGNRIVELEWKNRAGDSNELPKTE